MGAPLTTHAPPTDHPRTINPPTPPRPRSLSLSLSLSLSRPTRYLGEVGDIVVGRVTEVGSKRWKVNVGGHKDAMLHLSAVNLPGGVQRMRTYEDQLQMRK